MKTASMIENDLVEDESSVLLLRGHTAFAYTDGVSSERFLDRVFRNATDLSTQSRELETHIKDWSSEYHLTTKRAQLLSGFTFDRSMKVLEVGCGCGAITRFLGETFDNVTAVEGSLARARIARLRTRDLPSVSVVCAPFDQIRFTEKFDVIFAIGVFEYSASFVQGDDPYDEALKYFAKILTPNGAIVLAIENQFGLKYFNGSKEDHLGTRFEGLEGYHRRQAGVRTFGRKELAQMISRHFRDVQFYYPFPDYKIPDGVMSERFLENPRSAELISQLKSRDYAGDGWQLWDEELSVFELARNGMLPFFANSFLVVAGLSDIRGIGFDQLAIIYSGNRRQEYCTKTRVLDGADDTWSVAKTLRGNVEPVSNLLMFQDVKGPWFPTDSLLTQIVRRAHSVDQTLEQITAPAGPWFDYLRAAAKFDRGRFWLPGALIDAIWPNVYYQDNQIRIADQEWVWFRDIPLNVLIIRAITDFLLKIDGSRSLNPALRVRSGRKLVSRIARSLGIDLSAEDFSDFAQLEADFQFAASGMEKSDSALFWKWFFLDRTTLRGFRTGRNRYFALKARLEDLGVRAAAALSLLRPGA